MKQIKILTVLLFPFVLISQNLTGKVYDAHTTVKGAKVFNKNKRTKTYTDDVGLFNIKASTNDTLVITSLFHDEKSVLVLSNFFEDTIVIEIIKTVNNLDKVFLTNHLKAFNEATQTSTLGSQMEKDIKNNPHLYGPTSQYGLDFVRLAAIITKLFKKKKVEDVQTKPIVFEDLDALFSKDKLFNKKLLIHDFKIPEGYNGLFFSYCEAKNIDHMFLLEKNKFIFLDVLFKNSRDFLVMLDTYKKDNLKD